MKTILILLATALVFQNKGWTQVSSSNYFKTSGFIQNKGQVINQFGQINEDVSYLLSLKNGLNVQLKNDGFSYDTYRKKQHNSTENNQLYNFHRIDFTFKNATNNVLIETNQLLNEDIRYVCSAGNVKTNSYKEVIYKNVYENIDVVFSKTNDNNVKYDFIVHPGGNVSDIIIEAKGFDKALLNDENIVFDLSTGELNELLPKSWIVENNKDVKVNYKLLNSNRNTIEFGFTLPENNDLKNKTLCIDPKPNLDWGYYYGDSSSTIGEEIITDRDGVIYVAGTTSSLELVATTESFQNEINGETDAFIAKLFHDGSLMWASYYGGSASEKGTSVAVDELYNIYLVGTTNSNDLLLSDTTNQDSTVQFTPFQDVLNGETDVFITKFTKNGNLLWGTYYGSDVVEERPKAICDSVGNLFLLGTTHTSSNYFSTMNAFQQTPMGEEDLFISKFSPSGKREWSSYIGGEEKDIGSSIDLEGLALVISGYTKSDGLATVGSGVHQEENKGEFDGFITVLDTTGVQYWFTYFGGDSSDYITGAVINEGFISFTGYTKSDSLIAFGVDVHQNSIQGKSDAFLGRLTLQGELIWSTYFGGDEDDFASSISVGLFGDIVIGGTTYSRNNMATEEVYQTNHAGQKDVFIACFEEIGSQFWGTYYGGEQDDVCNSISFYGNTNIYLTGYTYSDSNITTPNTSEPFDVYAGNKDGLIAKFNLGTSTFGTGIGGGSGGGGSGGGTGGGTGGDGTGETIETLSFCEGDSLLLNIVGGALGTDANWIWYEGGCGGDTSEQVGIGDTIWVFPTGNTFYFVRAEGPGDTTNCNFIEIEKLESPTASIFAPNIICKGSDFQLFGNGEGGSHSWIFPNGVTYQVEDPIIEAATPADTGTYVFIVTASNSCTASSIAEIKMFDTISYESTVSNNTCFGYYDGEIYLEGENIDHYVFNWSHNEVDTNYLTDLNAGEYSVIITDTNTCVVKDSFLIVEPEQFVDDIIVEYAACDENDGSIEIVLNDEQEPYSIEWEALQDTTRYVDSLRFGYYTVFITNKDGCTDTLKVLVGNANELALSFVDVQDESCKEFGDGQMTADIFGGAAPYELVWSHDSTNTDLTITNLSPGTYEATVFDNDGCYFIATAYIGSPEVLLFNYEIQQPDCGQENGSIDIIFSNPDFLQEFIWSTEQDTSLTLYEVGQGEYTIFITDTNNCESDYFFEVEALNNLQVEASPSHLFVDAGDSSTVTAEVIGAGSANLEYEWRPRTFNSCPNCQTTIINPINDTNYVVTVTHEDGCYGTDTVVVEIDRYCAPIFIPDIFSPNKDNVNDEWCVLGRCVIDYKIIVFDRWGSIVFESDDQSRCWDGTLNGRLVQNGTYVYQANIETLTGETVETTGNITVQR